MSLQRIKNGKIDWNWILKELIRNCRNIGREIVIVCVMVNCGNFLDFGKIAQEKMKEYGIPVKRDRDVELLKDELEEQIVHLLPQEQINFGFMNGYGGILYKRSYDTNATKNHIELI